MIRFARTTLAGIFLGALPSACATPIGETEVAALMETQRTAWNQGDLAGFVSYYDASMTFCGSDGVTRGTDNLLEHYRRGYPTAAERGVLTFDVLEVRPLGTGHALVLGRYRIARAEPASGFFSVVVARTDAGLRIIHDHTSASPKSE